MTSLSHLTAEELATRLITESIIEEETSVIAGRFDRAALYRECAARLRGKEMPINSILAMGLRDIAKQSNLSGGQLLNPEATENWLERCASHLERLA